jgi:hypothetical protein
MRPARLAVVVGIGFEVQGEAPSPPGRQMLLAHELGSPAVAA